MKRYDLGHVLFVLSVLVLVVFIIWLMASYAEYERWKETREQRISTLMTHISSVRPSAPASRIVLAALKSEKHGVPAELTLSLMQVESNYAADAVSESNARGLMQLVESTSERQGLPWELAFDIEANVDAGVRYLAEHLQTYHGRLDLALDRYNGKGHPLADPLFSSKVLSIYRALDQGSLTVTAQKGDTLSSLAATFLGDPMAYPLLAAYNGIDDPNQIEVGQVIEIPPNAAVERSAPPLRASASNRLLGDGD